MKSAFAVLCLSLAAVGCAHGQLPTQPTLSCPSSATAGTYTPLNASSPGTGTAFADTTAGNFCYVVQDLPTGVAAGGTSGPSNTVGPLMVGSGQQANLSWQAPTGATSSITYVVSRAAAISGTVPTAPTASGTVSSAAAKNEAAPKDLVARVVPAGQ